ncbi:MULTISPECIES: helix-turn-helix transcriptional regulator [unclassified Streptomyces]|uniref:helix-turn-helix domain-containing protein n=1 Tax=unclassified Streptomyces TaxID=2593676 RepID=UPI000880EF70|nr:MULTISPECIES: helix-turn-helix transcriptional regulator [unclassified Streptomyces]PBC85820.1 LuxR family GAF modulated transcriptional regulator [Streptomyces sp. 2321.6]SDR05092.1 GAF modulated transcriptional regulator, LuxR family [Streptomyces sp. KS_16]SED80036.1 GAF modulated transcriptional regulator, LuxR family [Streptomyces sp. 2133.1]SED95863.1 GAF modulated transcriptional regulator, LuxR family [Streptomyces sp. 2112.3]SNC72698.1 GAF domain-containing protein [Streptomyces sp
MQLEPAAGDSVDVRAALSRLRRASGLPVAFGGLLSGAGRYRINELAGTETAVLHGLDILQGNGLGGKAVALSRPLAVTDYSASSVISHEYDAAVAAEGLRSVLAVPVIVRRRVRGVLYGALRRPVRLGDRPLSAAVAAARELEQALVLQDEAARLLSLARQPTAAEPTRWEEVREAHGELRALAQRIADPLLRQEMLAACGRLATASSKRPGSKDRAGPALSPREVDVLACVASGATNAVAAERLGLRPETVKSYLRSGMRKLGAHTRLQAVIAARRAGALP